MTALTYIVAYLGIAAFFGIIVHKVLGYLKKPMHVRWELYPVAHEEPGRAAYGGSYLEDSEWWKNRQKASLFGSIKGILVEFSVLHSTWTNNRALWYRTYPFHLGLYCFGSSVFISLFGGFLIALGVYGSPFMDLLGLLVDLLSLVGCIGIIFGGLGLIQRRLIQPDLRSYSTPAHFFNLGAIVLMAVLGLLTWFSSVSFFSELSVFFCGLLTFRFFPLAAPDSLFLIWLFIMAAYIPSTHMAHFFMKYFLYHDIRWGDQPTQDNPKTQRRISEVLGWTVGWKAQHIGGDGKKSWAEVATTNPTVKAGDSAAKE